MKKVLFAIMALCFASSLAFAAEDVVKTAAVAPSTTAATTMETTTTATTTTTTKTDALMLKGDVQGNTVSGYSIFAGGKLYKLDADSNAKVAEFLKKADSKLQVAITAKQVGDELSLVSIENQN